MVTSSTALVALFSACSTIRIFPLIALEVYFFGIRSVPLFQVNGPQKLAALKPAYTELAQKLFASYDRETHEHCIDFVASHAFKAK